MTEIKAEDAGTELPIYLKFLDNFMFVGVLIPVCLWLLFIYYFKQLPPQEYRYKLRFIWFSLTLFPLPIAVLVQILLAIILKMLDTKVYGANEYTGKTEILRVSKLYEIYLSSTGIKKSLLSLLMFTRISIKFLFGWVIFGGIILFFATAKPL